ncbi:MAG: hypothetical protein OXK77_01275 [Gemmatimonadota bacterium]|nr:hypothetical protein [Gemmatimonadota bacterium]MDE2864910.1 hypothetical protein [Gemmatimonadota bacterium]
MTTARTYRLAVAASLLTALLLVWIIGAVGLIGVEGDPFDRLYGGVLAVGSAGALIARFRPRGMARAMIATALAQMLVTVIALIVGKQHVPVSSVPEIVLLNGFYVALWTGSAWLFRKAARG